MKSIALFVVSASAVAFAVVACSSGSSGGGVGGGGGGGGCGAYFDSFSSYSQQCGLGSDGLNDRGRWLQYCQLIVGAPGASGADGALNQCASDVSAATSTCASPSKSTACSTFTGTLTAGTSCGESAQCASGFCKGGGVHSSSNGTTTTTVATCGVCADKIAAGQPCNSSNGDQCVKGATCVTKSSGGAGSCVAIVENDVGGACGDSSTNTCKDGLHCDYTMMKCAALGASGAACDFNEDCTTPLVCGTDKKCASAKARGAACKLDVGGLSSTGCARGDVCDATTNTCVAQTLVDPGGTCDYSGRHCKVGGCVVLPGDGGSSGAETGTCPTVLADGQACDPSAMSAVCNVFADCIGGKCTLFDPGTCK